jgi:hypothetical protein
MQMVSDNPTTLYIYPEAADIVAVGRAVKAGQSLTRAGVYWNLSCLREIRVPKFWPRETLEPDALEIQSIGGRDSNPRYVCANRRQLVGSGPTDFESALIRSPPLISAKAA